MNYKKFSAIYPNYLDSNKSAKLGRRIAQKDSVPDPTVQDIHEALASLNIRHIIQPFKGYSRDAESRWDNPGRVLFDMERAVESGVMEMKSDGAFDLDDAIPEMGDDDDDNANEENNKGKGKKQLLRILAGIIRDLPNRQKRLEEKAKTLEEEKLKAAKAEKEAAAKTKTGGSSGGGSGKKKKGKKKK